MTTDELIKALTRMKSETGSLADSLCCFGCGHEHNCGVHGCAVIREAVEHLNARRWISVKEKLPEGGKRVIVARKNGKVEQGYKDVGDWWCVYGTRVKTITHWMPLPSSPNERSEDNG